MVVLIRQAVKWTLEGPEDEPPSGVLWTLAVKEPYPLKPLHQTWIRIELKSGDRLRSKTRTAQINEALCKVLCHNLCCLIQSMYELGIEPTFWADDEHQSCNYVACPNKPGLADETKLSHRRLHRYRASRC